MTPSQTQAILDKLEEQNEQRAALASTVQAVSKSLETFQEKYDYDMRGEGKVNGYKGLIAVVQEIKDDAEKYPSILRIISMDPAKAARVTAAVVVGVLTLWFALHALAHIPAFEQWLDGLIGL